MKWKGLRSTLLPWRCSKWLVFKVILITIFKEFIRLGPESKVKKIIKLLARKAWQESFQTWFLFHFVTLLALQSRHCCNEKILKQVGLRILTIWRTSSSGFHLVQHQVRDCRRKNTLCKQQRWRWKCKMWPFCTFWTACGYFVNWVEFASLSSDL